MAQITEAEIKSPETNIRFPEADLNLLTYLSHKSGLFNVWNTSTSVIAKDLGISQQSVSRVLRDLEENRLIIREASTAGMKISLADNGRNALKSHYELLRNVFSSDIKSITCKITSGLGEGKYYMALQGYKKQFIEKLGFEPFEGTLNLEVDAAKVNNLLLNAECININGFQTKERTFGGLKSFRVNIKYGNKKLPAALIIPDRTHHSKKVVEVIAPHNLRNKLKLKEGEIIEIML